MISRFALVAVLAYSTSIASAQSFNIDVGQVGSGPAPTYAAAVSAGIWNVVRAEHVTPFTSGPHPSDYMLVDINGNPTGVGLHQYGGMDEVNASDPNLSGDNARLLNDYLATHSASLESCAYLNGLQNGWYEVTTYAWMPNQPSIMQKVRFDFHPGDTFVGGSWPGQHTQGITYARNIIQVTSGNIGLHVGVPSGGNTAIGAAWNGLQIRPLQAGTVPALSRSGFVVLSIVLACMGGILFRRFANTRYAK
ncbi:MAG: hypothetical protein AABZ47_10655 [Planctomycetota bacterium]